MAYNVIPINGGEANRPTADRPLDSPPTDRLALEAQVESSFNAILKLLSPSTEECAHDQAMIELGASSEMFVEPLGKHEVQVLACALYMEERESALQYHDVLSLTDRFAGKAMNITMVYKTIERLIARGMLTQVDSEDASGNRSRSYRIHGYGREAFRLAVLNSKLLIASQSSDAA